MCAPSGEVLWHGGDDLLVQIQAEVIAGRIVRKPLITDPDVAPVDLVDDRVNHPMRVLQASQVGCRAHPPFEPRVLCAPHGLGGDGTAHGTILCAAEGPSGPSDGVPHHGPTSTRQTPSL